MVSKTLLRTALVLSVLLEVFFWGACTDHRQHGSETTVDYERADPRRPKFILGAERTRDLRDRVTALKLGETCGNAIATVGPPDQDYHLTPAKPPNAWKWHYLTYYVVIIDKKPGNVYDQQVDLIFDRQDRLIAVRSNVDGISSRGDLAPSK